LDEWNANPIKTKNGEEVLETVQGPQAKPRWSLRRRGEDPDDRYLEVLAAALQNGSNWPTEDLIGSIPRNVHIQNLVDFEFFPQSSNNAG
jgi:hypothetical protein